ncbi:pentatricopeptide repeat-containing protein At4g21880, mitochondrial isoform X1 [Ziziphus jujuba]|uniref:Pentatricopeptide repeat-containing protein At4g21880, mitochondrial isoform X1 n=1 Tax=Ziziphus jujuba TaxID=326968 RepID=A0ABM3IKM7_ZIZJJ|nr:pentatricopeptide repeat-containing protein At4g21880, mitochondrial isoform X1 [Ziziphus jujuba]
MSSPFFTAADEFLPCFFSPTDNPALAASQVHRVYSVICHQNLKPISETFRLMITLCIKMKDFDGAYGMLNDLEKMNLKPTANMYNALLGGYFREKDKISPMQRA